MGKIDWKGMCLRRSFLALCLLLAACSGGQGTRTLTILHTNDLHARLTPDADNLGGFAYVAKAIQRERESAPGSTLLLNGGDLVQGTPVSTIFEGVPVFEVANLMGFDANTLGNHEFDYGWQRISDFTARATFPTVTANVVDGEGRLLVDPYLIREVNGIRIAIIGAVTADLASLTKSDRRGPWRALPVAETMRRYAREVRDQVDLVLVLSHIFDYEEDEILRSVPEVDLIVGGHNHGGQQEVKDVEGRLCVKVRAYGRELGRLDLQVDVPAKKIVSHNWSRIPIDAGAIQPDETVAKLVGEWEAKVADVVDVPIGTAKRRLGREELQPLIEQCMREATRADLAYMNSGGIRDSLPMGRILARHVWNMMPFDNVAVVGRVRGRDLPAEMREGRSIEPDTEYRVVTNDFVADQWAGSGIEFPESGPLIRDLFIDWIKERRVIE